MAGIELIVAFALVIWSFRIAQRAIAWDRTLNKNHKPSGMFYALFQFRKGYKQAQRELMRKMVDGKDNANS